jgi:hypothetical protein
MKPVAFTLRDILDLKLKLPRIIRYEVKVERTGRVAACRSRMRLARQRCEKYLSA